MHLKNEVVRPPRGRTSANVAKAQAQRPVRRPRRTPTLDKGESAALPHLVRTVGTANARYKRRGMPCASLASGCKSTPAGYANNNPEINGIRIAEESTASCAGDRTMTSPTSARTSPTGRRRSTMLAQRHRDPPTARVATDHEHERDRRRESDMRAM